MEVNGYQQLLGYQHSSEDLLFCFTEERISNWFGTTWGWVNVDISFIFGCTIPLKSSWWNSLLQTCSFFATQDVNWWTGVVWITCGLLWCFYQFIGFWWHPFTAKHSLVSKWCNAKFLQIDEETILDGMRVSTLSANFHFWVNYFFKPVYAFVIFIYTKNIMLSWIIDFPWPPFCRHMFSLSTVLLQQNDKSLWVYWKCSLLNYSTLLKLLLHVLCFRQYRWPL